MYRKLSVSMLFAAAILMINVVSCSKSDDDNGTPTPPPVTPPPPASACPGTPGPLFLAVKTLIENRCASCHNNSQRSGGANFSDTCNIITLKTRIKVRAVDEKTMPQSGALSQADQNKITDWINAGGLKTN
ncbi:MAG: hypothetical protein H7Y03_13375 [Chitinophagaceae bacterium]|nr:hypothetical protein [Chitinophagaceae bacterium]